MRLLPNVLCVRLPLYKSRGPLKAGVNPLLTSAVHTDHWLLQMSERPWACTEKQILSKTLTTEKLKGK